MIVQESSGVGGKWLDKKTIPAGSVGKIKTEATEQPSQQGGLQLVAKLLVKGSQEPLNVAISKPSKNALIQAFGNDTVNWIDKLLTLHTEKVVVSGKRGVALYLVPEGFEVTEDTGGFIVIKRIGSSLPKKEEGESDEYPQEDSVDVDSIPF